MAEALAVLLVEDSDSDAALLQRCLERAGWQLTLTRVDDEDGMRAALLARSWDIILSDFNLPRFSAVAALALLRASGQDIPFIVVSGNIGEEQAVSLVKSGVHDYVMKDHLARLPLAVRRELDEAAARSAHRGAIEALRASEERWHFALEGAGFGVWDWNLAEGTVLYSAGWLRIHGYEEGEIEASINGRLALLHPDDEAAIDAALQACLGGEPRFDAEYRSACRDGHWIWMQGHGMVARRDADDKPLRLICTEADITERKAAVAALQELNEELEARVEARTLALQQALVQIAEAEKLASLGNMVAGVSHELNTPIGNMMLAASTLYERLGDLHEHTVQRDLTRSHLEQGLRECRGASELVLRNGKRANELIESFKRVAVDQTSQRRRVFDLRTTLEDALQSLGATLRRAGVQVILDVPPIEMDSFPGPLEQIITNLVTNSVVHGFDGMERGGTLHISASCADGIIHLHYADNGKGIAPNLHHKVFEPFFTTRLGHGGSGLGLAIVHNLVQHVLRGHVTLESAPGAGLSMHFELPAVTPA